MVNTKKVYDRMSALHITQCALAEKMEMAQSTLSLKLNNKRPMMLDEADRMARILGVENEFGDYFLSYEVA